MNPRFLASTRSRLAAGTAVAALLVGGCAGSSGGGTAESWCDFADESDVVDAVFDTLGDDPAAVETGLQQVEEIIKRLPSEAPEEIADDAKVLADGTQMLIDAFADADYNLLDADLAFMEDSALEAELNEAGDNIDAYTERECGREFGADEGGTGDDGDIVEDVDGDSSTDFDPGDGTLREQIVAQMESIGLTNAEAGCIADNLDFADPAVQSGDVGAMLAVFETCGIGLDRLTELGG